MAAEGKSMVPPRAAPAPPSSLALHLALGLWGLSSWILFNGLWGQLPLFVRSLPEGNRVGVVILTAEQLAYVFPLMFMCKKRRVANSRRSQEGDIWLLLVAGLVISVLLSRYWDYQAPLQGVPHSVGLMALAFLTGAVCSSTGVVFTPYLANLPKSYTSAHTAGAGLSGLAVALLVLVADAGSQRPRLSVGQYFHVLTGAFLCSIAAFVYVSRTVHGPDDGGYEPLPGDKEDGGADSAAAAAGKAEAGYGAVEGTAPSRQRQQQPPAAPTARSPSAAAKSLVAQHWPIFTLQFALSALAYGIVPSLLPMACAGYGDPSRVLMLATVGFMCADPLGKLATSLLPTGRVYLSGLLTMAVASVLLLCAAQSPTPPLHQLPAGGLLPVAANTLFSFLFSFTSISIFFDRRRKDEEQGGGAAGAGASGGEEAYQWFAWSAFIIQTGAVCGTLGMAALAATGLI